jgi:hypothetical protein
MGFMDIGIGVALALGVYIGRALNQGNSSKI